MALIAKVDLDRAFVSLATDPANVVICGTAGSTGGGGQKTDVISQEGDFRNYANFNTRLILGTSKNRVHTLALRALTQAQVALIEAWVGKTILYRDNYGRRIFGAYTAISRTDIPRSGRLADVGIVIQEVSYTEGI
jgi:hypothetical protein